jgi:nucleotide-binding universal stress UspA family protein
MARRADPLALKRVLCATDFSENAAAALEAAVDIARRSKAEIRVVHVHPLSAYPAVEVGALPSAAKGLDEEARVGIMEGLDRFARPAVAAGVETGCVLRQGRPAEEIVREAQRTAADLIVMGRHSRDTPAQWLLGSVSEAVVRRARCPVLVEASPPRSAEGPRRILCAVDLGETSEPTLTCAAVLASALEADLLVLHVVAGPEAPCAPGSSDAPELAVRTVDEAKIRLAALVAGAAAASGRLEERLVTGVPHQRILTAAREGDIDLVVVGSHGDGLFDRQFIGSTTLHLLRESECAVLVVPARVLAATSRSDDPRLDPQAPSPAS